MKCKDRHLWEFSAREMSLGDHRFTEAHLEDCPACIEDLAAVHVAREALELVRWANPSVQWPKVDLQAHSKSTSSGWAWPFIVGAAGLALLSLTAISNRRAAPSAPKATQEAATRPTVQHEELTPLNALGANREKPTSKLPRLSTAEARSRLGKLPAVAQSTATQVPAVTEEWASLPEVRPEPERLPNLESRFMREADASLANGACERFLVGLEDLAQPSNNNEHAEHARILRARCFERQLRPRQAVNEYRKYLTDFPQGRYRDEARMAVGVSTTSVRLPQDDP